MGSSVVALLIVLIFNLETPRWLLHNGRTREAIETLNYIAWFNGVSERIPEDSVFIEAVSEKNQSESRFSRGNTNPMLSEGRASDLSFKGIQSYSKKDNCQQKTTSQLTLAIEFAVLSLYNMMVMGLYTFAYLLIARMGGDMFIDGIVLSLGECASAIGSGWALAFMSDTAVTRLFIVICFVFNLLYYYLPTSDESMMLQYVVLFLAVFG